MNTVLWISISLWNFECLESQKTLPCNKHDWFCWFISRYPRGFDKVSLSSRYDNCVTLNGIKLCHIRRVDDEWESELRGYRLELEWKNKWFKARYQPVRLVQAARTNSRFSSLFNRSPLRLREFLHTFGLWWRFITTKNPRDLVYARFSERKFRSRAHSLNWELTVCSKYKELYLHKYWTTWDRIARRN